MKTPRRFCCLSCNENATGTNKIEQCLKTLVIITNVEEVAVILTDSLNPPTPVSPKSSFLFHKPAGNLMGCILFSLSLPTLNFKYYSRVSSFEFSIKRTITITQTNTFASVVAIPKNKDFCMIPP